MPVRILITLMGLVTMVPGAERKVVFPEGVKPVGPYSPGILTGDMLYVSGQGARDAENKLPGSPEERVRQALRNVQSIVEAAGLTMEHVVYSQVYLHSSTPYEALNKVWTEFFPKDSPARATLGVHRMPTDTPVEINAVAVRDRKARRVVRPSWWPASTPISAAVWAGDRLYFSGLLGRERTSGRIPESPAAQISEAMTRVRELLKAAGLEERHLVTVNPYLTSKVAGQWRSDWGQGIEVSFLPLDANVEITGIASRAKAVAGGCVAAGDTVYCGPRSDAGSAGVGEQTRASLIRLGVEAWNIVAANVYLDDIDQFAEMNKIYGEHFEGVAPPARTTVAPLAPGSTKKVAISVVAVK